MIIRLNFNLLLNYIKKRDCYIVSTVYKINLLEPTNLIDWNLRILLIGDLIDWVLKKAPLLTN